MVFELSRQPIETDLREIEEITGLALTDSYKRTYLAYSGLTAKGFGPKISVTYPNGPTVTETVQSFLTVDEIRNQWQYVDYLEQFADHFNLGSDFVEPRCLVPIADLYDGAVYVAVAGRHVDKVFVADNGDFGIAYLADKLDEFVKQANLGV